MPALVILSEAKNLTDSTIYSIEILRLTPQNDLVGQPCWGDLIFAKILIYGSKLKVSQ